MSKPAVEEGYLGPQGKWKEYGLTTVNHNSPEFSTESDCDVKLQTKQAMKVTATLINATTGEEHKELVFIQTLTDTITIVVSLPDAGYFKLQIYALLASDESNSFPNVYNYLIHCKNPPSSGVQHFPKQFAQWKDGCYLHEPFSLRNQDNATFRVIVPGAKAVALTVGEEWFELHQKRANGPWHGEAKGLLAFKDKKCEKAALTANYSSEGNKYTSLLEYRL